MNFRPHPKPAPLLFGYDPMLTLPPGHLARLVELVVEETVQVLPKEAKGRSAYDPRVCLKVLVYGYATGVRSSRRLEQNCREHLAYLYLARGEDPSYRTLCTARLKLQAELEAIWLGLFAAAESHGLKRSGRIVVDSTKMRANASSESVLSADEYQAVREELGKVLAEAQAVDEEEQRQGYWGEQDEKESEPLPVEQIRDILRRVRRQTKASGTASEGANEGANEGAPTVAPQDSPQPKTATPDSGPPEAEPAAVKVKADAASSRKGSSENGVLPELEASAPAVSPVKLSRMEQRLEAGIKAIDEALADGRQQVSLTDPSARMMPEGRERKLRECHSYEVAVDNGLLVMGNASAEGNDNRRLEVIVEAAGANEPHGVTAVDADSGYYSGDAIGRLLAKGLDLCVPDSHTAGDLHRNRPVGTGVAQHRGTVAFSYDAALDSFECPQGNHLELVRGEEHKGQQVKVYRARDACTECPLAKQCLRQKGAKHRTIKVGQFQPELKAHLERFNEPEYRQRYRQRGPQVETIFGFIRGTLGYLRWLLRGTAKVACEARLFKLAYQFRKVHSQWAMT